MRHEQVALFISGRGSNAQAVMDLIDVNVTLVVSSKSHCWGVLRARRQGIPVLILPKKIDWQALDLALSQRKIQRIYLLGFMRLLEAAFCQKWAGRVWNLHPSLLPAFPGKTSIEDSYKAQADMGISIHEVTAELDAGPLLWQNKVIASRDLKDKPQAMDFAEVCFEISRAEQRMVRLLCQRA
jgi:phosphoribosylglycinamide formyltransferase-1